MRNILFSLSLLALPSLILFTHNEALSQSQGNATTGASLYQACVPCHTLNGSGLAGKPEALLLEKMNKIHHDTQTNPNKVRMQKILQTFNPQELLDLAAYMSKM